MRYDAGWRAPFPMGRYDRGYRPYGDREFGPPPQWRTEYGTDHPPAGRHLEYESDPPRVLQGPARYGLGPYHERLRRRRRPDEELREDVEDALFYDTWVDADAITVEVADGIVTLRGELPSYDEIRYATDDAWDIEGVIGVRTELRVKPS